MGRFSKIRAPPNARPPGNEVFLRDYETNHEGPNEALLFFLWALREGIPMTVVSVVGNVIFCVGVLSTKIEHVLHPQNLLLYLKRWFRILPPNFNRALENQWLEDARRCICYWHSPFVGDMLVFLGVCKIVEFWSFNLMGFITNRWEFWQFSGKSFGSYVWSAGSKRFSTKSSNLDHLGHLNIPRWWRHSGCGDSARNDLGKTRNTFRRVQWFLKVSLLAILRLWPFWGWWFVTLSMAKWPPNRG